MVDARRDKSLHLEKITHIVSNTIDFPQHSDAAAMMIPIVKSSWIQSSLNKGKPAPLRPFSPDPRMFFSEVVLSVADDIPPTDKESIIGATMAMGGVDSENVTKLVTHICALSMDNDKCRIVLAKNLRCKVVLPHWYACDPAPYLPILLTWLQV